MSHCANNSLKKRCEKALARRIEFFGSVIEQVSTSTDGLAFVLLLKLGCRIWSTVCCLPRWKSVLSCSIVSCTLQLLIRPHSRVAADFETRLPPFTKEDSARTLQL